MRKVFTEINYKFSSEKRWEAFKFARAALMNCFSTLWLLVTLFIVRGEPGSDRLEMP